MSEGFRVAQLTSGVLFTSIGAYLLGQKRGYNEGRRVTLMDQLDRTDRVVSFDTNYVKVIRPEYDAGGAMPFDQPYNTYCRVEWHHRDSVFPPPHWRDEVLAKLPPPFLGKREQKPPSEGGSCGTFLAPSDGGKEN